MDDSAFLYPKHPAMSWSRSTFITGEDRIYSISQAGAVLPIVVYSDQFYGVYRVSRKNGEFLPIPESTFQIFSDMSRV